MMNIRDDPSFRKLLPGFVISGRHPGGAQGGQGPAGRPAVQAAGERGRRAGKSAGQPAALPGPFRRWGDGPRRTSTSWPCGGGRSRTNWARSREDLRPWIIYRCQVGSKAFGLAAEDSDDDLRGIYLPPARLHWSLRRLPEQLEFTDAAAGRGLLGAGEVPAAGAEGQPQRAGDALDAAGPAGRRDGPGTAGHAAGVPLEARLQDLLGLRAEPVPPHGQRLQGQGHLQAQARHAPDPPAALRHRGPGDRARSASTWPSTATNCCTSATTVCRSRRSSGGRWNWTSSSSRRSSGPACPSSRITPAWTIS